MNIAFDALAILGPMSKNRGIGNYALSQFKKMIELDTANHYYFFNLIEEFSMEEQCEQCENITDVFLFTGKNNELIRDPSFNDIYGEIVQKFIYKYEIDIFYITSPFESNILPYENSWFGTTKIVTTVYDIIPYVLKDIYLHEKVSYDTYMNVISRLRGMDEYYVISQSVKDDMIHYLDFDADKIKVIYGAADPEIYRKVEITSDIEKKIENQFSITDKFIMCTGGDDERKNLAGLITAYSLLSTQIQEQYQLVIVCKLSKPSYERYTNIIKDLSLEGRVICTNFVDYDTLIELYNMASLLVFPSKYEGFGLPVIEAWMCGTPVLTSNNSSLGEIGGEAALLVDPYSCESIAEGITEILQGDNLNHYRKAGMERVNLFTWEKVACKVIENFVQSGNSNKRCQKLKIAMFTPLPPLESGISDYSVDIINSISDYFDIDVYVDNYEVTCNFINDVRVFPYKEFDERHCRYDRIIYQVGNSLYHKYMFSYIKKYSGIVVLHDLNLKNVLEAMYVFSENRNLDVFTENLLEDLTIDEAEQYMSRFGQPFLNTWNINGFVTNYASKTIVHSDYAKRYLLKKDIGRNVKKIPLYTLLEDPVNKNELRESLGISTDKFVFAAFGHVHETKRALQILDAFKLLSEEVENICFYFVGKLAPNIEAAFNQKVKEDKLESKVIVTGFTELDVFEKIMSVSDACLNLRYPYNGESSASCMRLLGKAKLLIVNKIGSFDEIPDNACIKISNAEFVDEKSEIIEIYEAMKTALDDNFRHSVEKNALQYARNYLDIEKISALYKKEIEDLSKTRISEKMIEDIYRYCILNILVSEKQIKMLIETILFLK